MAKHHPDLIFCRKQAGVAIGRLCEKCDGKCVICDSYVRPCTLVRICDECNYGSYQGRCVICGGPGVSDAYYCKECTIQEKDSQRRRVARVARARQEARERGPGELREIAPPPDCRMCEPGAPCTRGRHPTPEGLSLGRLGLSWDPRRGGPQRGLAPSRQAGRCSCACAERALTLCQLRGNPAASGRLIVAIDSFSWLSSRLFPQQCAPDLPSPSRHYTSPDEARGARKTQANPGSGPKRFLSSRVSSAPPPVKRP
ncbi:PHD finger-like domain-containing protein 5A [Tupaia chinensis]|uniref:PHD finger-like domain-containing protein 5A n=1 Tax=Tupaia chinensis TaxID=246437 RepID=L9KNR9_TUPCH|nr:PHD finger-like domain-containing protein 5A [Tupaia chinensis]